MSQATAAQCLGISPSQTYPYSSSLSSSASSSSSSVFSVDAPSHVSSSNSSVSSCVPIGWESDEWSLRNRVQAVAGNAVGAASQCGYRPPARASTFPLCQPAACRAGAERVVLPSLNTDIPLPAEQRQHPRRSSTSVQQRPPPPLVRQCERKINFVDSLVG